MKNRQLVFIFASFISAIFILVTSCRKINESTELGGDLIPPVDNITTFDTTITVEAYNDLFTLGGTNPLLEDSTRTNYTDEQFLGIISNDPLFGKTDARMFFELKPPSYKFSFINKPDSLHIDSVVLVLDYIETYGDSTISQSVNVYELNQTPNFKPDSSFLIRRNDLTYTTLLGNKIVRPMDLKDSVKAFRDTTARQLRIRLDDAFGERLLSYDTIGIAGAYSGDSSFTSKFRGFAVQSVGAGNAIMGFNLQGANTKLAIYYKDDNGNAPVNKWDTAVSYFIFKPYASYLGAGSSAANYVIRNYSGLPIAGAAGGTTPDPLVYIQNAPGSFATIKTPVLGTLKNAVIHRAELIAEQAYHISDSLFPPPNYLYIDAFDPTISKYRTIPYDLVYDAASAAFNFASFGILPGRTLDGSGNPVRVWKFNLTRYVQHVVNDTEPVYDLRLFSPLYVMDQYKAPVASAVLAPTVVNLNPAIAKGRVRLVGNTGPTYPNPHRMRIRIIYSKL